MTIGRVYLVEIWGPGNARAYMRTCTWRCTCACTEALELRPLGAGYSLSDGIRAVSLPPVLLLKPHQCKPGHSGVLEHLAVHVLGRQAPKP